LAEGVIPATPLPIREFVKNTEQAPPAQIKEFQEKVESVLYTAIMIRPDVAFATSQLSHFLQNPSPSHINAINWTIRYLFGTRFLAIQFTCVHGSWSKSPQLGDALIIASDASFVDDIETRRSSHGFTIMLFGGLIM
jgi:hypothetical protein